MLTDLSPPRFSFHSFIQLIHSLRYQSPSNRALFWSNINFTDFIHSNVIINYCHILTSTPFSLLNICSFHWKKNLRLCRFFLNWVSFSWFNNDSQIMNIMWPFCFAVINFSLILMESHSIYHSINEVWSRKTCRDWRRLLHWIEILSILSKR